MQNLIADIHTAMAQKINYLPFPIQTNKCAPASTRKTSLLSNLALSSLPSTTVVILSFPDASLTLCIPFLLMGGSGAFWQVNR